MRHFFKGIASAKLYFTPQFSNNSFQKKKITHQITYFADWNRQFLVKLWIVVGSFCGFTRFSMDLRNGIGKNK